jgi:hypothetical protein
MPPEHYGKNHDAQGGILLVIYPSNYGHLQLAGLGQAGLGSEAQGG